jgi:hypothetical protein
MKTIEWRRRFFIGISIITAGVAGAAPDIGFYCDFTTKDLNTGSPATGTLTNVTTVSGGALVVPTNTPAGVTYGMARQYLNTSGAGWGTNTIAAIVKLNSQDAKRHVIYSSSGGSDNSWGIILFGPADTGKPKFQVYTNGTTVVDLSVDMTVQSNVNYFIAASWNDQGAGNPMSATLYVWNRYTKQSWFTNQTSSYNTPVPPNTSGGTTDPLGQIRLAGRQSTGVDALNGIMDAVWGVKQFTGSQVAYAQLVSDLGADQTLAVHVALSGDNSDGTTWAKAYTNLQTAVNDSNAGYGIWVKQGVYGITNPITLGSYVSLYGGFNGTESALSQRNWILNQTIISNTVTASLTDWYHRVIDIPSSSYWRLDGLIIQNGSLWATNSSTQASVRGCGVQVSNVSGVNYIDNCVFRYNKGGNASFLNDGGGLMLHSASGYTYVRNSTFLGNEARAAGGFCLDGTGTNIVMNCMIVSNNAPSGGGARILAAQGKVVNCVFYRNTGYSAANDDRGAGIRCDAATYIANSIFKENITSTDISVQSTNITSITVSNCCFHGTARGIAFENFNSTTTYYTNFPIFNALANKGANITADPKFVTAAALDFTFPGSSPCVDAGTAAGGYAPTNDFYGNPRPVVRVNASTPYDIGIYEIGPQRGSMVMIQ